MSVSSCSVNIMIWSEFPSFTQTELEPPVTCPLCLEDLGNGVPLIGHSIQRVVQKLEFSTAGGQDLGGALAGPEAQVRSREVQGLECQQSQSRFSNHERCADTWHLFHRACFGKLVEGKTEVSCPLDRTVCVLEPSLITQLVDEIEFGNCHPVLQVPKEQLRESIPLDDLEKIDRALQSNPPNETCLNDLLYQYATLGRMQGIAYLLKIHSFSLYSLKKGMLSAAENERDALMSLMISFLSYPFLKRCRESADSQQAFEHMQFYVYQVISEALFSITVLGNEAGKRLLFENRWDPAVLGAIVFQLIEERHTRLALELLAGNHQIDVRFRGNSLLTAIRLEQKELIEALLWAEIPEQYLYEAFLVAVKVKDLETVRLLIATRRPTAHGLWNHVVLFAAEEGNLQVVQELCKEAPISFYTIGKARQIAARNHHQETARWLLKHRLASMCSACIIA